MNLSDIEPNIIDARIMAPPNTDHDISGMKQHHSRDTGKEIIMVSIIEQRGMVHVWHMPIFYFPPVNHNELPLEDDIHGERGQENPNDVRHPILFDNICEQQATIKLFPTASPPPKPPPPKPPPHRC